MYDKLILIDMDMVIADFNDGFHRAWVEKFPDREVIPLSKRKDFYLTKDYGNVFKSDIVNILHSEGFFLGLSPLNGALEGFAALKKRYKEVRICTTPLRNAHSSYEKWMWVANNLSEEDASNMILCRDKTLIMADYLIDDKPNIEGLKTPVWKHIIFTQPYNIEIEGTHFQWGDNLEFD